jgi:predicted small secreted protein
MRKMRLLLIAFALRLGLAGCATFRGMGEDIENLGKGIQKTAS